ncbi:ATP-dependent Clp protease proteolytic subunit [Streptosporangium sp. NBC_01755]|uniref:head maturation protease, ClpP-related n=1 Tax=Streptosporangium sp. NBC_01755 TaxID=2975949 RepID=UPI002DDC344B|nr:head maturation protease, ClpP-related [Streptosporangium sp. NBC_01755]WSD03250.1 ATP-dependent Clp protease proteolytic subunit [Streptosporangium sp. NBC_01755]
MRLDRQQLRAKVGPERQWYRITNLADPAEVVIYDEIGYWGTSAETFLEELRSITASEISLRINSPGGEIFDGIAIHNVLRSHTATVTVYVDSLAASIASVIAMAGDRIIMQPHSQMMIHDGSGFCYGQAGDMREMADLLDRQSDNIAGVYAERAGGTVAEWRARMQAETWYTADEAVAAGLADEVARPVRQPDQDPAMAASWDLSVFRFAGRSAAPAPAVSEVVPVADPEPVEPTQEPEPVAQVPADVTPEPTEVPALNLGQAEPVAQAVEPDEWAALAAHLIHPPSAADVWESLREALL